MPKYFTHQMTKQEKEDYQSGSGFDKSLREYLPHVAEKTIKMHYSDAFYAYNNKDVGINLKEIILNDQIPDDYIEKVEKQIIKKNNEKDRNNGHEQRRDALERAKGYKRSLEFLLRHIREKTSNTPTNNPVVKQKAQNTNNPLETNSIEKNKKKLYEIVSRIREIIVKINKNCKNRKKEEIFIDSNMTEIWNAIEKVSSSEEVFIKFALNLYKLMFEKTRKPNPKYEKNNQEKYYYFLLPEKFIKDGTETRHFLDIVGTLRHHYAHIEPEYNVSIRKISYPDILQKLLKTPDEPPNYQKLQIEILKLFENSMEKLNDLVKNPPT